MSKYSETLLSIAERSPLALAGDAELATGDAGPGAHFLRSVRDDVLERVAYAVGGETDPESIARTLETLDGDGTLHQIADGAVPTYTNSRWEVFVDLSAWTVDASDLLGDMGAVDATEVLFVVADTLTRALMQELQDAVEADEAEEDDE